ncbi:MAG: alpha-L-fucosidase [Oscillospiraceae bacterium]|nr:alpha-L-fucosidase [Oscillospiraceae bacterium]
MKFFKRVETAFHTRVGAYVFFALAAAAFVFLFSAKWAYGWIAELYPLGGAFVPTLFCVICLCGAISLVFLLLAEKSKRKPLRAVHTAACVLTGLLLAYTCFLLFGLDKGLDPESLKNGAESLLPKLPYLGAALALPLPFVLWKKTKRAALAALCLLLAICLGGALMHFVPLVKTEKSLAKNAWHRKPLPENAAEMIAVLPSARQLSHGEDTEFYAFFHFGINTFTGSEWGTGQEDPMLFDPTSLDTDQWIESIAAAGMTGAIITAKHHDGFCLWPTEYSDFSVKNSAYQEDVVARFAESCRKYGVKFGFYLSPWDRNAATYGQSEAYNDYYVQQLTELLTNYGEVFEVWFDGAVGEEYKGIQSYDWDRWVALVRELQPNACTAIAPPVPDVAWVGNEDGLANGNVSSVRYRSEQWIWARSECDVSIRPGWFYHEQEEPKSLDELMHIYYNSIGMNCSLLLNIPPNKEGRLDQKDVDRLAEFGRAIDALYENKLPAEMTVLREGDQIYALDFKLEPGQKAKHIVLSEELGQAGERITKWSVYAKAGALYFKLGGAESAGGKTILRLNPWVKADSYRILIEEARGNPALRDISFYG